MAFFTPPFIEAKLMPASRGFFVGGEYLNIEEIA